MALIEQELLKAIGSLNRIITKFENTVASSIGSDRANNKNFANEKSPNEKGGDDDLNDKFKELSKAAENARKSLNKNLDSTTKHIGNSFSDIIQRMGNSVTNAFPFKVANRAISDGLLQMENDFAKASPELKNNIREFVQDSLSDTGIDTDSFILRADGVNKSFMQLNGIIEDVISTNKISEDQSQELIDVMSDLKESGIDVLDVFDDADGSLESFIKLLEQSNGSIKDFSDDSITKLKKFNESVTNSGNIFANSVLNLSENIDKKLSKSFVDLARKSDELGANLTTALKVGIIPAAIMEGNALSTLVQDGFRSVNLLDLGFNAADFGQSQTDFSNNLKEFRTSIRLLAQSPDVMGFAAGETFNSISEDIRNRFGIAGAQNTQFLGKQLETFAELGIKPTLSATQALNKEIQTMSGLGNKSAQEIQDTFLTLAKDKSFKAFFMSIGGGEKGLSGLSKSFTNLQKQVGFNIDEFISLQQEIASQRDRTGSTRVVEGAFAARLAEQLGFGGDDAALIRQGVSFNESLVGDQRTKFEELLGKGGAKLTEAINLAAQNQNVSGLQRLNVLREGAGIFGKERPEALAAQESGTVELFKQIQDEAIKTANIETGNMTKFATAVSEFVTGIKGSPVGLGLTGIGAIFGDLGSAALGGLLTGVVMKNGLKGGILGLGSGIVSTVGSGLMAGFKRVPWIAGIYAVGNGIFDAINEQDNLSKPKALLDGIWDGVANVVGGIPDMLFGTNISGFLSNLNFFDAIGTKLGEWTAMSVQTIGGWFDNAGDFFTSAFGDMGTFFGGINDTITGWFAHVADGVGNVMGDASILISDISSGVGNVLEDAGDFITDGFTSGWDAITSFFGNEESPASRVNKKEQELSAKRGEERLQQSLDELSKYMSDLVDEQKSSKEQANEHHIENKITKKIENKKRFNGMLGYATLGQEPV